MWTSSLKYIVIGPFIGFDFSSKPISEGFTKGFILWYTKMEGNKDESEKCLKIGERCISEGLYDKAEKFLNKAERLYPTSKAKGSLL